MTQKMTMTTTEEAGPGSPAKSAARPNGRKGSRKVRTGCITCKMRKVKCDETRPGCRRCAHIGRRCGGYGPETGSIPSSRGLKRGFSASPPPVLSAFPIFATDRERRSFQFFRYVTATVLASDYEGDFWYALVFKLCRFEGAVRHAVLALSCLHETLVRDDLSGQVLAGMEMFTLQQYNLAISSLTGHLHSLDHSQSIETFAASILFVCMEFMQKKDAESLGFLQQGRRLLQTLTTSKSADSHSMDLVKQHIVPIYLRVGLTALIFGWNLPPVPVELDDFIEVPTTFSTIKEARHHLYALTDACLRWRFDYKLARSGASGAHIPNDMQNILLSRLSRWHIAFALLTTMLPTGRAPAPSSLLLQIYYHFAKILTAATTAVAQTDYDSHIDSFSVILLLAAKYLAHLASKSVLVAGDNVTARSHTSAQTASLDINLSTFSFEPGVVPALYFTAVKCRHPHIRKAAVDMLLKYGSIQECLWTAHVSGCVAARFVEIESGDIRQMKDQLESPFGLADELRLRDVILGPPGDGGVWVTFVKQSEYSKGNMESWREFVLTRDNSKALCNGKAQVCRGLELSCIAETYS